MRGESGRTSLKTLLERTITDVESVPPIERLLVDGEEVVLDVPQHSLVNVAGQLARQEAEAKAEAAVASAYQ